MLMSIGHSVPGCHADVSGLCCHLGPDWYLWSRPPLWALSGSVVLLHPGAMFVVCAVTRKHVEVHGWSVFLLTVKSQEATFSVTLIIANVGQKEGHGKLL